MKDTVETEAFNEAMIVLEKKRLLWVKCVFRQILSLDKINKRKKSQHSWMMKGVL